MERHIRVCGQRRGQQVAEGLLRPPPLRLIVGPQFGRYCPKSAFKHLITVERDSCSDKLQTIPLRHGVDQGEWRPTT